MAPSSQKNTKSVVTMWRGPLHAYHDGLRAVITEAAASGSLSGPSVRGPGGTRIFPVSGVLDTRRVQLRTSGDHDSDGGI